MTVKNSIHLVVLIHLLQFLIGTICWSINFNVKSLAGLLLQTGVIKSFWGILDHFRGNSVIHSTLCFIACVMGVSGQIGMVSGVKTWHSYICNYANTWSIQFVYMFPAWASCAAVFYCFVSGVFWFMLYNSFNYEYF